MVRRPLLVAAVAAGLLGCKSYEPEWRASQSQLQAAEARIDVLRKNVETLEQAVAVRDQAIAERDGFIRDECVRRTKPKGAR